MKEYSPRDVEHAEFGDFIIANLTLRPRRLGGEISEVLLSNTEESMRSNTGMLDRKRTATRHWGTVSIGSVTERIFTQRRRVRRVKFRNSNFFQLRDLSASGLRTIADPFFGGSAVQSPSPSSPQTEIRDDYPLGNLRAPEYWDRNRRVSLYWTKVQYTALRLFTRKALAEGE